MILSKFLENISRGNNDIANLIRQVCVDLDLISYPFGIVVINPVDADKGIGRVLAFTDHTGSNTLDYKDSCTDSENGILIHSKTLCTVLKSFQPAFMDDVNFSIDAMLPDILRNCHTLLSLPIFSDGKVVRFFLLLGVENTSPIDIDQLLLLANMADSHVARMNQVNCVRNANVWIHDELEKVAELQQLLLPQTLPTIEGIRIATSYRACEQAGGDYYDIVSLSHIFSDSHPVGTPDFWGAIVADATGHGAAAAVEVAMLDAILRTYKSSDTMSGVAGVFDYVNQHIFTRLIRGTFITACGVAYRTDTGDLIYANAGHPPPLLRRGKNGEVIELNKALGIPLCVSKEFQWENAEIKFDVGDLVVLYTDGITEAITPCGKQYGLQQLKTLIENHNGEPDTLVKHIENAIDAHQKGAQRKDDQTIIVVQKTH